MTDITLNINGNGDDAKAALKEVADETTLLWQQQTAQGNAQRKQSEEMWASIAKWSAAAATAVAGFGAASVKAFMEADRVQKQLERSAGAYAEVLGEQAAAMEELFAIDGEVIKQSQTLLTQWGGVGAATEDVTRAILDYATATGQDAVAATEDLIRNVESGGVGLAKMGVHFEATGDKGKDLGSAVSALSKKFGGAAAADADSLHGSLQAVALSFENLQEHVGAAITDFNNQQQITVKLAEAMRGLDTFLFGDERLERAKEYAELHESLLGRIEARKGIDAEIAAAEAAGLGGPGGSEADRLRRVRDALDENIESVKRLIEERNKLNMAAPITGAVGRTNKAMRAAPADIAKGDWFQEFQGPDKADSMAEESARLAVELEKQLQLEKDSQAESLENLKRANEAEEKEMVESYKQMRRIEEQHLQNLRDDEQKWKTAGDALGGALVGAIASQLAKLSEGGEVDPGEMIGDVIASILQVAGTVVGSVYGGAAGGALGGALGGVLGSGVRAITRRKHDGGWVEPDALPRFHSGAWVGSDEQAAVLQYGERVLSRREVQAAGGADSVDAMARGAGVPMMNFTIQTMDALGVRGFFENDGGRGFYNAIRTGRGVLGPVFGGG